MPRRGETAANRQRRDQGDGSLFWDEDRNRWVGVVELDRTADGKRRRVKVSGRTKDVARTKLREALRRVESGLPVGDQTITVEDYLKAWKTKSLPASVKAEKTRDNIEWAVEKVTAALGKRRLRDLTPDDVEDFLNDLAGMGYAKSSLIRVHSTLKRALRQAERTGKVPRNVAALVDTPDGPVKQARSLTVDQAKKLLATAKGDRLEALVLAGITIGPRPSELLGLTWDLVDLDNGIAYIYRALTKRKDGTYELGDLKNAHSRRTVELPAPLVDALKVHKKRQAQEQLKAGGRWQDELGLVFTTTIGTPVDLRNLRRALSKLTKDAGLGHWHPHELRHSAASILSALGVPLEQIGDLLGHANPRVTGVVYRHLITPTIKTARGPMEQTFGAPDSAAESA